MQTMNIETLFGKIFGTDDKPKFRTIGNKKNV